MPTRPHSRQPDLKELFNGMLTLLNWQEQLVREALARLADDADGTDDPATPHPPLSQSR